MRSTAFKQDLHTYTSILNIKVISFHTILSSSTLIVQNICNTQLPNQKNIFTTTHKVKTVAMDPKETITRLPAP